MGFPWVYHELSMGSHGVPMGFPWVSPWGSHGFPWGFPWGVHGVPMGSPWVFPWGSHGVPMASPWWVPLGVPSLKKKQKKEGKKELNRQKKASKAQLVFPV